MRRGMNGLAPLPNNNSPILLAFRYVILVITLDRLDDAVPLARALVAGRVRLLEVILRTPASPNDPRAIMPTVPDAAVGSGPC